jgi:molecular chaperone DnaK (HSP70)
MKLGIDFGTTRTVVTAQERGNYPICTFSWKGELKEYIPSLVAYRQGRLHFGWDAAALIKQPDALLLRSIKRLAGRMRADDPVFFGADYRIPMLELVSRFLTHVRRTVERYGNIHYRRRQPLDVMVATPANSNSNQRFITLEAFRRAGFSVLGALNEPSAAAVEFMHHYLKDMGPKSPKRYVIVYDLGGGTFDASVVKIVGRGHDVLAYEGIAKLGGDDFDEKILELALEKTGIDPTSLSDSDRVRLLEECRERKESLRVNTRKMVVDVGTVIGDADPVVLDTAKIYDRCSPLIQKTLLSVQTLLRKLEADEGRNWTPRRLAAIYLVGGSVSFPPVARILRDLYAGKVRISPFPHASPAIGLAIAADRKTRIHVRESVSRWFGIWREMNQDKIFDPIIRKDEKVDPQTGRLVVMRDYRPRHNIGQLSFLECSELGKAGEPEGDITVWKEIHFPYDPELEDLSDLSDIPIVRRPDLSNQEVRETYHYSIQGIVHVEIENRTTGHRRRYRLEPGKKPLLYTYRRKQPVPVYSH